ncbi:membrane-bound alpha-1,6- mannosyltransferase Initiation-specific [Rhizoclosmatium sp. JEL0117]|nr:membrane-bound alpha-1,6- mannosyltransferase Initiation-specific [Rhizoclosmatium sp. JEL0117]
MTQAEVDRIWAQWRKTGMDVIFQNQFKVNPNRLVAATKEYEARYWSTPEGMDAVKIPKLIHQTYKTKDRTRIESSRLAYMDTWITMNPGFNYTVWTDDEMWRFVRDNYGTRVQLAYKKLPMVVQKADFFRYLVVNKYGGYYTDTDTRCARNLNWWRIDHEKEDVQFIVGVEWYVPPPDFPHVPISVTQWAFASAPNHPILQLMIETVTNTILSGPAKDLSDTSKVVEITGPVQWTRVIRAFMESRGGSLEAIGKGESVFYGAEEGVLILPPIAFSPGTFEPNITKRDERTVLYHEFAGNKGWKKVRIGNWWNRWIQQERNVDEMEE